MTTKELVEQLTNGFKAETLAGFLSVNCPKFRPDTQDLSELAPEEGNVKEITQIGTAEYNNASRIIFVACKIDKDLTGKESKKTQYELGKKILKQHYYDAGIFAFYGSNNHFRLSLIAASYFGTKREFSSFRRYTYFVSPEFTNKTIESQLDKCKFSSIENILEAFSIEAVSEDFYEAFKPKFDEIVGAIKGGNKLDNQTKQDFALLFAIRIIFLGFVQKKGWLGSDRFIQNYWSEYKSLNKTDEFYTRWLEPLFFQALNSEPGVKVEWSNNDFSKETEKILQMAPYLNGELFKRKEDVDTLGLYLPDSVIGDFFDFLFQYNFTIDENTAYDEELELNPEFLGIIFEKFVNKEQGSVYTPRPEVDLMCRLSLLRWLEKKNDFDAKELHYLFFREGGTDKKHDADQKDGNFSENEIRKLLDYLENVTVCDPAAGSGAFEVGMLHIINEIIEKLYKMPRCPADIEKKTAFERKKAIIARSLYGVEVQGYAVWINQLRLWLTLFIDMPDEMKLSHKPLLPSLNFKIRRGDSLVQRIGNKMFPVHGHADIDSPTIQRKITELKKAKIDFYYNQGQKEEYIRKQENDIFRAIIDSQIIQKQKELASIAKPQKQMGLGFGQSEAEQKHLLELETFEKRRQHLQAEIAELTEERKSLQDAHPLIWSIEFAEIFYDKKGFDIIIGNPPYVRQEEIKDPEGKVSPKEYKQLLCQMAALDFDYFKDRKIDGKSDLYTFFYVRSLNLLNKSGVHCFICSNSWLDVGYGVWLQEFLLQNVPVNLIIDNHARRSFSTADVNTIISIFDAPDKSYNQKKHLVKFVAFKKPFDECIFTENIWKIHEAKDIYKNDTFRVYPITAEKLYDEGWEVEEGAKKESGEYIGDKWGGKYLKAPDIFFTILKKGKDKLIKIKEIAEIRRGFTTGCNDFFYLTTAQAKQFKIEEEFLKPVIKSPRECKTTQIEITQLQFNVFMCSKSKSELKGTNALKYIEWGEKQDIEIKSGKLKGKKIIGFHKLETVKNRKLWYSLEDWDKANFVQGQIFNDRFFFTNPQDTFSDCVLNELIIHKDYYVDKIKIGASLNSTITAFFINLFGRSSLGEGALKQQVCEIGRLTIVNPELINKSQSLSSNREIFSIFVECGIDPESKIPIEEQEPKPLPDRKELDDIVFDAIGLTPEERKDVYRAVCRLVWNRISKAKSV